MIDAFVGLAEVKAEVKLVANLITVQTTAEVLPG